MLRIFETKLYERFPLGQLLITGYTMSFWLDQNNIGI